MRRLKLYSFIAISAIIILALFSSPRTIEQKISPEDRANVEKVIQESGYINIRYLNKEFVSFPRGDDINIRSCWVYTANATDPDGNESEISLCVNTFGQWQITKL